PSHLYSAAAPSFLAIQLKSGLESIVANAIRTIRIALPLATISQMAHQATAGRMSDFGRLTMRQGAGRLPSSTMRTVISRASQDVETVPIRTTLIAAPGVVKRKGATVRSPLPD